MSINNLAVRKTDIKNITQQKTVSVIFNGVFDMTSGNSMIFSTNIVKAIIKIPQMVIIMYSKRLFIVIPPFQVQQSDFQAESRIYLEVHF